MSSQYQYPFWTPDESVAGSMVSIDDSLRKRSQSGSNELRERLSAAAVRAKRAGKGAFVIDGLECTFS